MSDSDSDGEWLYDPDEPDTVRDSVKDYFDKKPKKTIDRGYLDTLSKECQFDILDDALNAARAHSGVCGVTSVTKGKKKVWELRGIKDYSEDFSFDDKRQVYNKVVQVDLVDRSEEELWLKKPKISYSGVMKKEQCNFKGKTLFRPNFDECTLTEPDFSGCTLVDASFKKAKIIMGNFKDMNVVGNIYFSSHNNVEDMCTFNEQLERTAAESKSDEGKSVGQLDAKNKDIKGNSVGLLGLYDLSSGGRKTLEQLKEDWEKLEVEKAKKGRLKVAKGGMIDGIGDDSSLDERRLEQFRLEQLEGDLEKLEVEKAKKERLKVAKSDMEKSLAVFLPRKQQSHQQDEERQGASADNVEHVVLTEEESNFKDETLVCPVFNGITFTNANFSGCTLISARFRDCIFAGTQDLCCADFSKTTFLGGVTFYNSVFHGPDDFHLHTYSNAQKDSSVTSSKTNEKTTSPDSTPSEGAEFTGAKFDGLADFSDTTFNHKATFAAAVFASGWSFANALFCGKFTCFDGSIFYGIHRLLKVEANGTDELHFSQTRFESYGDVSTIREISHDCHDDTYVGSRKVICATSFRGARFDLNAKSSKGFNHASFKHFADFEGVKVHSLAGETSFTKTEFNGGVTFQDAQFGCAEAFLEPTYTFEAVKRYQTRDAQEVATFEGDLLVDRGNAIKVRLFKFEVKDGALVDWPAVGEDVKAYDAPVKDIIKNAHTSKGGAVDWCNNDYVLRLDIDDKDLLRKIRNALGFGLTKIKEPKELYKCNLEKIERGGDYACGITDVQATKLIKAVQYSKKATYPEGPQAFTFGIAIKDFIQTMGNSDLVFHRGDTVIIETGSEVDGTKQEVVQDIEKSVLNPRTGKSGFCPEIKASDRYLIKVPMWTERPWKKTQRDADDPDFEDTFVHPHHLLNFHDGEVTLELDGKKMTFINMRAAQREIAKGRLDSKIGRGKDLEVHSHVNFSIPDPNDVNKGIEYYESKNREEHVTAISKQKWEETDGCIEAGFESCKFGGDITSFVNATFNCVDTSFTLSTFGSSITSFKGCSWTRNNDRKILLYLEGQRGDGAYDNWTSKLEHAQSRTTARRGSVIDKADVMGEDIIKKLKRSQTSFKKATFTGIDHLDFSDLEFLDDHIDFQDAVFSKIGTVTFEQSLFDGNARFRGSQFDVANEVSFKDCHFDKGFDFVGSSFRGDGKTDFEHCIFHAHPDSEIPGTKVIAVARMAKMKILTKSCSFYRADFASPTLFHNFRIEPEVVDADFRGCNFGTSEFYQVDLGVARLGPDNAHHRTDLSKVTLTATTMLDKTVGLEHAKLPPPPGTKRTEEQRVPETKVVAVNPRIAETPLSRVQEKKKREKKWSTDPDTGRRVMKKQDGGFQDAFLQVADHLTLKEIIQEFGNESGYDTSEKIFLELSPKFQVGCLDSWEIEDLAKEENLKKLQEALKGTRYEDPDDSSVTAKKFQDFVNEKISEFKKQEKKDKPENAAYLKLIKFRDAKIHRALTAKFQGIDFDKLWEKTTTSRTPTQQVPTSSSKIEDLAKKKKLKGLKEALKGMKVTVTAESFQKFVNEKISEFKKQEKKDEPENAAYLKLIKFRDAIIRENLIMEYSGVLSWKIEYLATKEIKDLKGALGKKMEHEASHLKEFVHRRLHEDDGAHEDYVNHEGVNLYSDLYPKKKIQKDYTAYFKPKDEDKWGYCNFIWSTSVVQYFVWWSEEEDKLGAQISQINFALEYLHFLQLYNLDSTNWQEFRDGWMLLQALRVSARNNRLRIVLGQILITDDHGRPNTKPEQQKSPDELGHTWTTPTEVLQKIDTLKMCFSRSGPPLGVVNALKSVGREIKTKKYLGWRKAMTDEIGYIETVKKTKGCISNAMAGFLLAFVIGVFNLFSNILYDRFFDSLNITDGLGLDIYETAAGAASSNIPG